MAKFDNRSLLTHLMGEALASKLKMRSGYGRPHFFLDVNGKKIVYCYIRKNACSAFKKLFVEHSHRTWDANVTANPINFMIAHHRAGMEDIKSADHTIFVYRDPIKRLLSAFRNKFIEGKGAEDIWQNVRSTLKVTKEDDFTFERFCLEYIQLPFEMTDPHILPQANHLLPIIYTNVIPIERLESEMACILGEQIASSVFSAYANPTSGKFSPIEAAHLRSIRELKDIYRSQGVVPNDESLLTPSLMSAIRSRYIEDIQLIERIDTMSRSGF